MGKDGRHRELQRIAGEQWEVLRTAQIRDAGFSTHEIHWLQRNSIIHSRFKGIYTYATNRPPPKGVLLAAQWSCGDDAYLTGRTALAIEKVRGMYLGRIEVAVPRRTVRAREAPIHLQRVARAPEKLRRDGPLRYATVARALLDMAVAGAAVKELRHLITEAIHLQKLDHPEMRALLEAHAGQSGLKSLRAAYGSYLPRKSARSGLERSYDRGLATREKDELKAAKLAIIGIQIMYVSDRRWELEPETCLDDLEGVLAARGLNRRAAWSDEPDDRHDADDHDDRPQRDRR